MRKKLLVVDDDKTIIDIVEGFLQPTDVKIFTSQNPIHALHVFTIQKPQIVLSDLNLGTGMDGLTLCGKIRTMIPKTITIAMTGYLSAYDLGYCLGSGMFSDAITKPVKRDLLIHIVQEWFRKRARWDLVNGSGNDLKMPTNTTL